MNIVGKTAAAGAVLVAAAGILAGGAIIAAAPAAAQAWTHRWKHGHARWRHQAARHARWRRHHARRHHGHRAAPWGNRWRRTWLHRGPGRATGIHVRRGRFANHVAARHLRRTGPGRWATAGGYGNTRGGGFVYRGQAQRFRGGAVEHGRWAARNGDNGTYTGFAARNRQGWVRGLHVTNQRGQSATLAHGWRREADGSRTWALYGRGPDGRAGGLRWNSRTGWTRY